MTLYYLQLLVNGVIAGSVYALFAVGLTLVYGVCRFINFAHGELITWGAYLALLFASPPFGLPLPLAALPALGLAQERLVYRPLGRRSPVSLLIASIGLAYLLRNMIRIFWGSDLMTFELVLSRGLSLGGIFVTRTQILMAAVAVGSMALLWLLLTRTHLGKSLRAVSDNAELAEIMGIDLKRVYATVWILAALFAGSGGILLALDTNLEPLMGLTNLIKAFAALLLGGAGNVWGALLGGLIIGIAENLGVAFFPTGYKDLVAFAVIFLMLLIRPQGIFALKGGVR